MVYETAKGWEFVGKAFLYGDLSITGGEKKFTDLDGKRWDLALPGMFHFEYVKAQLRPIMVSRFPETKSLLILGPSFPR
jgi:hypothetical protein